MKHFLLLLLLTTNFAISQIDLTTSKREQISFELYDDFKYIQDLDPTFIYKKTISSISSIKDFEYFKADIYDEKNYKVWLMVYPTNSIEYRITTIDKNGISFETYGFMKKLGKNRMLSVTYSNDKEASFNYFLNKDKVHNTKN